MGGEGQVLIMARAPSATRLWPFVWQAIVPAGGLSGRRLRCAMNFSGFAVS
jgi:hypothetical protein